MLTALGGDLGEQETSCMGADLCSGLADGGQRYRRCGSEDDVVVANDGDVFWHPQAFEYQSLEQADRKQVIGGEHRSGTL